MKEYNPDSTWTEASNLAETETRAIAFLTMTDEETKEWHHIE